MATLKVFVRGLHYGWAYHSVNFPSLYYDVLFSYETESWGELVERYVLASIFDIENQRVRRVYVVDDNKSEYFDGIFSGYSEPGAGFGGIFIEFNIPIPIAMLRELIEYILSLPIDVGDAGGSKRGTIIEIDWNTKEFKIISEGSVELDIDNMPEDPEFNKKVVEVVCSQ